MLEGNGFEVEDVGDGQEALERVSAGSHDLMVLDLNTPCLDGFEVMTQKPEARIRQSLLRRGTSRRRWSRIVWKDFQFWRSCENR